ncbi:hypothetical protein BDZ89DRAFT_1136755 [Hymenopellis radicata]|nr:hypothetical protein BDZ89DRAFT_1136755 [Hymenopellis radicata]
MCITSLDTPPYWNILIPIVVCSLSLRVASGEACTLEVVQNFFTKALSKHKKSLTSIDIYPFTRLSWLSKAEVLLALSQCTRIRLLHLDIDHGQSPNTVEVFLDLLPSWHSLSEVEFYTPDDLWSCRPPETSAAVVDCLLAFRTFRYTYAMQMLTLRCFIWQITPKVFQDGSYRFSARVSYAKHAHDGDSYEGLAQHVRMLY